MRVVLILGIILIGSLLAVNAIWANYPLPERANLIETNYLSLRERFVEESKKHKGSLSSFILNSKGPRGERLTIDTLWIGTKNPKRVFLHISGTHGVEGYAGSAIQTEILKDPIHPPEDTAVVFIHGLNPWGMAHHRRFNESNVDLNRNFLVSKEKFAGAPDAYRNVEWFLNPQKAPAKLDLFFPKVLYLILRYGFTTLKQAIAGGQYEFPKGIYYGGNKLEASNKFLKNWVLANLTEVEELFVIEVHTGLGESGVDLLFWPLPPNHEKTKYFEGLIDEKLDSDDPKEGAGFKTPGDLQNEVPKLIPKTEVYWVLQEFGAVGPITTLRSLRNENAYSHFSETPQISHWSKLELVEAFSPGDTVWQEKVLHRGKELALKAIKLLDKKVIRPFL